MSTERLPFVLEADVRIEPGTDPCALGAAVTTALCGHWEHEGPCRWPHNNAVEAAGETATFRTLFIARPGTSPRCGCGSWTASAPAPAGNCSRRGSGHCIPARGH